MAEPRLGGWPAVTAEEMREVDRIMLEELHIELVQMMENAGRCLAEFTIGGYRPSRVVVLAGAGGNGGGGLAAARHLANRGVEVVVAMARPAGQLTPAAAHQHDILTRMGIAIHTAAGGESVGAVLEGADVVIDALVGYSLRGPLTGRTRALVMAANDHSAPTLALDVPSGVHATTGPIGPTQARADATLTLALPKVGLVDEPSVGRLFLADISVPPGVYERIGLPAAAFGAAGVVELYDPGVLPPGLSEN